MAAPCDNPPVTGRLPFNPGKMAHQPLAQPVAATPSADTPLTVSQLAGRISHALTTGLPARLRVIGEISGFKERTHWYFDLKDAGAVVNCVMFATAARRVRFTPRNGQEVVITGRVEFYDKQGKVTLLAEKIEPVGAGALELAFRALCEEIRGLGWFSPERKRPIPSCPRVVAVITSRTGAALQDVLDTMRKRCPSTGIQLVDVRVQGEGAAGEVAAAIAWVNSLPTPRRPEVILITRGGGSMEDLWAFNERIVAEAIVNSQLPIVAAIGHETDTTIAELVADLRCATPTQAAMRLTPDRRALMEQLDSLERRLTGGLQRSLRERRKRVIASAKHPFFADPRAAIDRERRHVETLARHLRTSSSSRIRNVAHHLERLAGRLEAFRPANLHARRAAALESAQARLAAAIRQRLSAPDLPALEDRLLRAWDLHLDRADARILALARQLTAVGPHSVLQRGFSYTMKADGTLIRSVADAAAGNSILTRVSDGEIQSIVGPLGAASRPTAEQFATPTPRRRRKTPTPANQMDLFASGQ
jgi:exodeoxyribonuclease VII large subunit